MYKLKITLVGIIFLVSMGSLSAKVFEYNYSGEQIEDWTCNYKIVMNITAPKDCSIMLYDKNNHFQKVIRDKVENKTVEMDIRLSPEVSSDQLFIRIVKKHKNGDWITIEKPIASFETFHRIDSNLKYLTDLKINVNKEINKTNEFKINLVKNDEKNYTARTELIINNA